MPKKATEDNLELFNLLVSSLSGVDDEEKVHIIGSVLNCLLYTSDAADE